MQRRHGLIRFGLLLLLAAVGQAFRLAGSPLAALPLLWCRRPLQGPRVEPGPRARPAGRRSKWIVAAASESAVASSDGQGDDASDGVVEGSIMDVEDESTVAGTLRLEVGNEEEQQEVPVAASGEEEDDVSAYVCMYVCIHI